MNKQEREQLATLTMKLREAAKDALTHSDYVMGKTKGSLKGRLIGIADELTAMLGISSEDFDDETEADAT